MNELDETIKAGLAAATKGAGEITPERLAACLRERGGLSTVDETSAGSSRRPRRWLSAAAVLVLVAGFASFGIWHSTTDDDTHLVASDRDPVARGFDGWDPGWHKIDPGPVPASSEVSMAYFDNRLFVAALGHVDSDPLPGDEPTIGVWAFDPTTERWSTLPAPPFGKASLVAAGEQLMAVGGPSDLTDWAIPALDRSYRWATLDLDEKAWTDRGDLPVAPQLKEVGSTGPYGPGGESLVWTGERVIDLTRGAVLDPRSGDAAPLTMPGNLIDYTHLISATPVWTGKMVVLSSWSRSPGLAWDRLGAPLPEIPGPPMAEPNLSISAIGVALDGKIAVIPREDPAAGRAAVFDPTSGIWTELPPQPESGRREWCPSTAAAAAVDGNLIMWSCEIDGDGRSTPLLILRNGKWSRLPLPPRTEHGIETWLGTDQGLVIWSGDFDTINNPAASYLWAAVWIPDPHGRG